MQLVHRDKEIRELHHHKVIITTTIVVVAVVVVVVVVVIIIIIELLCEGFLFRVLAIFIMPETQYDRSNYLIRA